MWSSSTIGGAAPAAMSNIKTAVEGLKTATNSLYTALSAQAELAKATALSMINSELAALVATCDEILALLASMDLSGISAIELSPMVYGVEHALKFDKVSGLVGLSTYKSMQILTDAMDDEGDFNRPHGPGNFGAHIFVVSAGLGDVSKILGTLDKLGVFFSAEGLAKLGAKLAKILSKQHKPKIHESVMPDFISLRMGDIFPALDQVVDSISGLVLGIKNTTSNHIDAINAMIKYYEDSKVVMDKLVKQITDFMDLMSVGISGTGFYSAYVPVSSTGIEDIKQLISNKDGFPAAWEAHEFSVVFMIAGGAPITTMAELIGS